jgi:hypothetical protein
MPVIETNTTPEMAGDPSLLSEEKRAALGPSPICTCIPFVKKTTKGYCPDMRKCQYTQTIIALHALQDLPVRTFHMQMRKETGVDNSETKDEVPRVASIGETPLTALSDACAVQFDILQDKAALHSGGDDDNTGCIVWNSSVFLMLFLGNVALKSGEPAWMQGRAVLELGAGTGVGSLACRVCGAQTAVATDRNTGPATDNFTALQVLTTDPSSSSTCMRVCEYSWGVHSDVSSVAESMPFDLILLSDVLYFSKNVQPLLDSVFALLRAQCGDLESATTLPLLLLSQKHRATQNEEKFFGPLRTLFNVYVVDEYEHSRGGKVSFVNESSFNIFQGRERELETRDPQLRMVVFVPMLLDDADVCADHWMLRHMHKYLVPLVAYTPTPDQGEAKKEEN